MSGSKNCGISGLSVLFHWSMCLFLCQTGAATVENSMEFPQKLKMELSSDPAIPLLGLYPRNPETPIHKNLCTPVFIAAQSTIVKGWKQPKCPSVNEWIKNCGTFTQWNTTAQRKKELLPFGQHGWNWRALC